MNYDNSTETTLPNTFKDMPLNPELQKAIESRGYVIPTEIQKKAIPILACEDIDFLGQAQTGTGKTAAFVLPLLNRVDPSLKAVQAIILTPTRELANQVCSEMAKFCPDTDYRVLAVYGGTSMEKQLQDFRRMKPHVVVATPGRALDLIRRGVLKLDSAKIAVLDEADVMLDMGFMEDVTSILDELAESRNIWLFSATMPPAIRRLVSTYLKDPVNIAVQGKALSAEGITQKYFSVRRDQMLDALCRLLLIEEDFFGIVFCKMKIDADEISNALNARGILADALHGDLSQQQRDTTMKRFKEKKVKLLVCTDVAARGIDVDNLTHVVNFSLPQDLESYVHRIGRTGRAGATGVAWSLVDPRDSFKLKQIERLIKVVIPRGTIPTGAEVRKKLIEKDFSRFQLVENKVLKLKDSEEFLAFKKYFEGKEYDQTLKVFFDVIYSERMEQFSKGPAIGEATSREGQRDVRNVNGGGARIFMNMGKDHGLDLKTLLKEVSEHLAVEQRLIKRVDIKGTFSFMEVPPDCAEKVIAASGLKIAGRNVRYEISSGSAPARSRGDFGRDSGRDSSRRGGNFSKPRARY